MTLVGLMAIVFMVGCTPISILNGYMTNQAEAEQQAKLEQQAELEQQELNSPVLESLRVQKLTQRDSTITPAIDRDDNQINPESSYSPFMKTGSGVFLQLSEEIQMSHNDKKNTRPSGEIALNFEGADLREFIKVVFEEILHENYVIDQNVQGVVNMNTPSTVQVDNVFGILESILQVNGAAAIFDNGVYHILPVEKVKKQTTVPTIGNTVTNWETGYGTQIVPMKYVSAMEMKKTLESMGTDGASLSVNEARNFLIITGPRTFIDLTLETVSLFDVDWLEGMSFALFPLEYADASIIVEEINNLIEGSATPSPLSGIIRLVPIQRLNSVMVVTHQPEYLKTAKTLIQQFDQGTVTSPGQRFYVYHLKYSMADEVAGLLQELFGNSGGFSGSPEKTNLPAERSDVRPPTESGIDTSLKKQATSEKLKLTNMKGDTNLATVNIIPDLAHNALLILASAQNYRAVEATIKKLDIPPMQVLIEATIAEVSLTGNLNYGIRWFLQGNAAGQNYEAGLNLPFPGIAGDGLALGILNSANELRAFVSVLEENSTIEILSAPQIMVLNNQTATFRVGDQIPITTRSSQSTGDTAAPIISEVQFRDTGTLLTVTPHVNEGGMVTLEVSQEVSVPGAVVAVGGGGNVSIAQRTIDSTVVVNSGQTVILGGLINENNNHEKKGIPWLMDIPIIGAAFSETTKVSTRTELIIMITPRVVTNPLQAKELTDEIRKRFKKASEVELRINNEYELSK
jgi:general secretion pathway protein D